VAKEIEALLRKAKLPPLVWTDNMDHLEACEHILVHLDSTTWTRGIDSDDFATDVCTAMMMGVHRLLAHEVPGARCDDEARGGCMFNVVMRMTPEHLLEAGIYNEISMNLAGGDWRTPGLIALVREIAKGGGSRESCVAEPVWEWAPHVRSSPTPPDQERRKSSASTATHVAPTKSGRFTQLMIGHGKVSGLIAARRLRAKPAEAVSSV